MGDLLPPAAAAQAALTRDLLERLARSGYDLVTPPLFEHAQVLALGHDAVDHRDMLRFVEPGGEIAVLRPDITPQVARIIATHLAAHPAPYRLCYEGRVLRRPRGRARKRLQMSQVGIECVGIRSPQGDVEVIGLAIEGCRGVGLRRFLVELTETGLAAAVLDQVPEGARPGFAELVRSKDAAALGKRCREAGVARGTRRQLEALIAHYGGLEVIREARKAFKGRAAQAALDNLDEVAKRLKALGHGDLLAVDLAETRGLAYYTGVSFSLLADGPGERICSGGRYDNLLGRFGEAMPAAGFALELDNLQWALRTAGTPYVPQRAPRVIITGGSEKARELDARTLREQGWTAVTIPASGKRACLDFAAAWGYDGVLWHRGQEARVTRVTDEAERTVPWPKLGARGEVARWIRAEKG